MKGDRYGNQLDLTILLYILKHHVHSMYNFYQPHLNKIKKNKFFKKKKNEKGDITTDSTDIERVRGYYKKLSVNS